MADVVFIQPMEAQQKLAALRNRENQRRSRARRKDYIQELEQRIRTYEVAGVKATAEVQAAARKVAEENTRLRSLLSLCGVDNEKTEEFLRTGNASFVATDYTSCDLKAAVCKNNPPPDEINVTMQDYATAYTVLPTAAEAAGSKTVVQHPAAEAPQGPAAVNLNSPRHVPAVSQRYTSIENMERTLSHKRYDINSHTTRSPPALESFGPEDLYSHQSSKDYMPSLGGRDEISCLAAAEIIAGMRGHDDPEEVWPELGCDSSGACMVKNIAMFQIMDK